MTKGKTFDVLKVMLLSILISMLLGIAVTAVTIPLGVVMFSASDLALNSISQNIVSIFTLPFLQTCFVLLYKKLKK